MRKVGVVMDYKEHLQSRELSSNTIRSYMLAAKQLDELCPEIDKRSLDRFREALVREYAPASARGNPPPRDNPEKKSRKLIFELQGAWPPEDSLCRNSRETVSAGNALARRLQDAERLVEEKRIAHVLLLGANHGEYRRAGERTRAIDGR